MNFVECTNIAPGYKSDHSIIELKIIFSQFKRGKGCWRFNKSLLYDKEYVKKAKETIYDVLNQYKTQYEGDNLINKENFLKTNLSDMSFSINDQLLFECILLEIRGMTIKLSSLKTKKEKQCKN